MDPDVTLSDLHWAIDRYHESLKLGLIDLAAHDAAAVVAMFGTLDGWLSRGGFLPRAWRQGRDD